MHRSCSSAQILWNSVHLMQGVPSSFSMHIDEGRVQWVNLWLGPPLLQSGTECIC